MCRLYDLGVLLLILAFLFFGRKSGALRALQGCRKKGLCLTPLVKERMDHFFVPGLVTPRDTSASVHGSGQMALNSINSTPRGGSSRENWKFGFGPRRFGYDPRRFGFDPVGFGYGPVGMESRQRKFVRTPAFWI